MDRYPRLSLTCNWGYVVKANLSKSPGRRYDRMRRKISGGKLNKRESLGGALDDVAMAGDGGWRVNIESRRPFAKARGDPRCNRIGMHSVGVRFRYFRDLVEPGVDGAGEEEASDCKNGDVEGGGAQRLWKDIQEEWIKN